MHNPCLFSLYVLDRFTFLCSAKHTGEKMAAKAKKLCKWKSEDITQKLGKFSDIVRNPQFVCTKCGRVADKKKWLHKPTALK